MSDIERIANAARAIADRAYLYESDVHERIAFWFREFADTLDPITDSWDD